MTAIGAGPDEVGSLENAGYVCLDQESSLFSWLTYDKSIEGCTTISNSTGSFEPRHTRGTDRIVPQTTGPQQLSGWLTASERTFSHPVQAVY
jgi:hypothetical protein